MLSANPPEAEGPSVPVITPALRRRLQQCYDHAQKLMAQPKYDFDSANTLLAECVVSDPGNLLYVEAYLENLGRKYGNNRRGAKLQLFVNRGRVTKAQKGKQWLEVIKAGTEILKTNPWDIPTLRSMAEACEHLQLNDVELRYLKNALDGNPKDVEVNRHCARSLARMGQYDQAIACWARVSELKPNDPEALKMIGDLQVESDETAKGRGEEGGSTRWQVLERDLAVDPSSVEKYLELAEAYGEEGRLAEAQRTLQKGLSASGSDLRLRERLEEVHLLRLKQQLGLAQKRAQMEGTESAKQLVEQLTEGLNREELEFYGRRAERYPNEEKWKFELGVRLKRSDNYSEAIKRLAEIPAGSSLAAAVLVESGECWQHLRQYAKALKAYQGAIESAEKAGQQDQLKLALYRGGVLGGAMGDPAGREFLARLVRLDPEYRDAQQRLDKLGPVGQND